MAALRSQWVAATTRTSARIGLLPPTRSNSRFLQDPQQRDLRLGRRSPISSRKIVPPFREFEPPEALVAALP